MTDRTPTVLAQRAAEEGVTEQQVEGQWAGRTSIGRLITAEEVAAVRRWSGRVRSFHGRPSVVRMSAPSSDRLFWAMPSDVAVNRGRRPLSSQ